MSADNYLLIRRKRQGWYVFERKLSTTYPRPEDGKTVKFNKYFNPDGLYVAGPFPTEDEAYEAAEKYAEDVFVEYGIEVDSPAAALRAANDEAVYGEPEQLAD